MLFIGAIKYKRRQERKTYKVCEKHQAPVNVNPNSKHGITFQKHFCYSGRWPFYFGTNGSLEQLAFCYFFRLYKPRLPLHLKTLRI